MAQAKKSRGPAAADEEYARLVRDLAGELPAVVVLRGEESFYRDLAVRYLVDAARKKGLEVCRHDSHDPEFKIATLVDDLQSGALFSAGRCVVLRGAGEVLRKGSRAWSEAAEKALAHKIEQPGQDLLVLEAEKLRADLRLLKAAAAKGTSFEFRRFWDSPPPWNPDPRQTELVQWILRQARQLGVSLKPEQGVYIAAATGNDLAALEAQLERAAAAGGKVEGVVVWEAGGSPFAIADLLVAGEAASALAGLENLFRGGFAETDGRREQAAEALVAILGPAVSGKARETLRVARDGEQALAGSPRQKEQVLERVGRRSTQDWARLLDDAATLERRARSGPAVGVDDWSAFALRWRLDRGRSPARRPGR